MNDEGDIQTYPVMPVPYDFKSQEEFVKAKQQVHLATMRFKGRLKKMGKDPYAPEYGYETSRKIYKKRLREAKAKFGDDLQQFWSDDSD